MFCVSGLRSKEKAEEKQKKKKLEEERKKKEKRAEEEEEWDEAAVWDLEAETWAEADFSNVVDEEWYGGNSG